MTIIQLADVTIGPLVVRIIFSHAALDKEDGGYNDDEDARYDADSNDDVCPGPDVVERHEALSSSGGDIWQRLPGRHT